MPHDNSGLLANFVELCRVPSPSLHEREAAKVLAKKIRALGFEPLEDDAAQTLGGDCGNIVVKVPATGKGPKIMLSAHMDTVEKPGDPPANPVVDGNWIRREGGGILGADDKTGVAILLEVLSRLSMGAKHGELLFAFTVAEEIEARGAAALDPELYGGFDFGLALDYSLPSEIVVAAPTKVAFRMIFHGTAGHAAAPENRINAAHVMAGTMARLPIGRLDEFTTANLGVMRSGTAINIIPGSGYAEYELRSHRKDVLDFHVKRVIGIIEGAVRENRLFALSPSHGLGGECGEPQIKTRQAQVDVDVEVSYEGYRHDEDDPVVKLLASAVKKAGLTPALTIAQGGSDANILNRRGLKSLVIGNGMYGPHSDNERANLADMADTVEVIMNLVSAGAAASARLKR